MRIPASGLDLIQATADNRFGGDISRLESAVQKIIRVLGYPGQPFVAVGNHCLVNAGNQAGIELCQEYPDRVMGSIIDEHCEIRPGAVIIGSYITGTEEAPTVIDNESTVYLANVRSTSLKWSIVKRTHAAETEIIDSYTDESFVVSSVIGSTICKTLVQNRQVIGENLNGLVLGDDPDSDRVDLGYHTASLLELAGIVSIK